MLIQGKGRGNQRVHRFENGYGASVISDGYGSESGLYELGVIRFAGDTWHLTYETPITDDVIGWLSAEDVDALLIRIEALTEADNIEAKIAKKYREIDEAQAEIDRLRQEILDLIGEVS